MRFLGLALIFAALTPVAFANDQPWPSDIRITGYLTDFGSELRVNDVDDLRGSDVDLEDELDLDNTLEELRVDLRWRFKPRHLLDFAYYDISRKGERMIDRSITIGDETYVLGTDLDSELEFKVYKLGYAYSFVQSDSHDATVSIGVHLMDIGFSVRGDVLGVPVNRHTSNLSIPLPVLGAQYSRRLGEHFTINFDAELFSLEYNRVRGSLADLNISLDWDFTERFGATIGYNLVDMNIKSDDSDLRGKLQYKYDAITLGVRFLF